MNSTSVLRVLAAACAGLALTAPAPAALAQQSVSVQLEGGAASRSISLPIGKSAIVDLPVDARDVLVSNPKVADAVLRTPRRIYVLGQAAGQTDAVFFDGMGRQILNLNIRVDQSTSALQDTLSRVAPDANVRIEPVGDSLVLTGTVASAAVADQVARVAERFVADPKMVVNALTIAQSEQVMLKVRVVEVQRTMIKQLGFDTNAILGKLGSGQFTFTDASTFAINSGLLGGVTSGYSDTNSHHTVEGTIKAFERVGLARTLAEPNLSAVSGESAEFLAGGEYPVPTGLDTDGRVTIEFKKYGVYLSFTPVVLSAGRISLKLTTEESELSDIGSFSLSTSATTTTTSGSAQKLSIPGLIVRRASTTVELPSGGAMMIAGLMQEQSRQNIDSLPGMTNLPVLGALFRSRDYLAGETELVVIITPYLVKPVRPGDLQTPADGLEVANDASTVLLGRLNKASGRAGAPAPGWQGPVGYVIE